MEDIFVKNYRELKEKLKDTAPADKIKTIIGALRDTSNQVKERQDAIKSSTFQTDEDGTNYGVGNDGMTYSYTMQDGKMQNVKKLSADEQKTAIGKISNGKVNIDPQVTNQRSLTDLLRSTSRMYQKGGNLVPTNVEIRDMNPGSYALNGIGGVTYSAFDDDLNAKDIIQINGLSAPDARKVNEKKDAEAGWSTSGKYPGEYIPTHELSHSAENTPYRIKENWYNSSLLEAKEKEKVYPIGELLKKAISDLFGQGYEIDKSTSVGKKMAEDASANYDKWNKEDEQKYGFKGLSDGFVKLAAERAGFKSVADAAKDLSGYAGELYPGFIQMPNGEYQYYEGDVDNAEVFAEAYSDVLLNGDDAKPFSKELIALYQDYVDTWRKRTGIEKSEKAEATRKRLTEALNALPDFTIDSKKSPAQIFNQRYKMTIKK